MEFRVDPWATVLALVGGCAWLVSSYSLVRVGEQLALVVLLNAVALAVLGRDGYRLVRYPMLLLFCAVPIGTELVPILMEATAIGSGMLLTLFRVAYYQDGMLFQLAGGHFEIVTYCSGLRYLFASLVFSLAVAYECFQDVRLRVFYVAVVVVLAIALNSVRAATVMGVASWSEMRWLAGEDHIYFGWVLFCLAFIGFAQLGGLLAHWFQDSELRVS